MCWSQTLALVGIRIQSSLLFTYSQFREIRFYRLKISVNRETCSLLLHMGAHTMVRDSNRWTTFHHCAAGGCVRTTKALLAYHSTLQLEATDQDGNTPLHIAARCGNVGIVELMLSRGADVTVFNKQMMTCLDVAIEYGKEKVAEVLIKNDQ